MKEQTFLHVKICIFMLDSVMPWDYIKHSPYNGATFL